MSFAHSTSSPTFYSSSVVFAFPFAAAFRILLNGARLEMIASRKYIGDFSITSGARGEAVLYWLCRCTELMMYFCTIREDAAHYARFLLDARLI